MGFLRIVGNIGLKMLVFVAGYSFCRYVSRDDQYEIERHHGTPYLVDTTKDQRLPIDVETFQVGSLEYRVRGVLDDPQLPTTLEDIRYDK